MTHLGAVKKKKDTDKIGVIRIIVIIFKTQGKKNQHQIFLWKCHPSLPSGTVIFLELKSNLKIQKLPSHCRNSSLLRYHSSAASTAINLHPRSVGKGMVRGWVGRGCESLGQTKEITS